MFTDDQKNWIFVTFIVIAVLFTLIVCARISEVNNTKIEVQADGSVLIKNLSEADQNLIKSLRDEDGKVLVRISVPKQNKH